MNDPIKEDDASTGLDTSEDFIEMVEAAGDHVVIAAKNELQIDIDTEEDWRRYERSMKTFFNHSGFLQVDTVISRSGLPHRHVTIKLPYKVGRWQRLALQAALGSDPIRELLSSLRYIDGDLRPTLFREEGPG